MFNIRVGGIYNLKGFTNNRVKVYAIDDPSDPRGKRSDSGSPMVYAEYLDRRLRGMRFVSHMKDFAAMTRGTNE